MATHPVLLPRESHGQGSLTGYSLRGCKELDMTERLSTITTNSVPDTARALGI